MGNRSAKFVAALLAGIVAGAPLPAVSQSAPSAAEDCLAAPKGAAPEGQHWYYRIDRGTKRQCWYLREEGARPAQAAANSQPAASPAAPLSQPDLALVADGRRLPRKTERASRSWGPLRRSTPSNRHRHGLEHSSRASRDTNAVASGREADVRHAEDSFLEYLSSALTSSGIEVSCDPNAPLGVNKVNVLFLDSSSILRTNPSRRALLVSIDIISAGNTMLKPRPQAAVTPG